MKKVSKIASALALSAVLSLGLAPAAFADSTATYTDHDEVLTFEPGTDYHETDLFDGLKNVMPGDERSQKVVIVNGHSREANFYLAVEAHDGEPHYSEAAEQADGKDGGQDPDNGDVLGGEGERDEDAASMADFLAQLTMRVKLGDRVLFEGAPSEAGTLEKAVLLGEVAPGKSLELTVELSVPRELGNEYAYRVGEVDWVFTVEELDPVLPSTGDTLPVAAVAGVALCALLAAVILIVCTRRRNER